MTITLPTATASTPGQPDILATAPEPTTFTAAVLPWYCDRQRSRPERHDRARMLDVCRMGVNIQCPRDTVEDYVGLLCREAELVRTRLPEACSVTTLWLRGNPSRQFSPEAVTELIFRLNSQFPLATPGAVRGVELSVAALSAERLALLVGLGFNHIGLRLDATLGSDERSLGRVDAMQRLLADFTSLTVHCEVLFGSQSHPRYLARLLAALRRFPVASIELKDAREGQPQVLADRRETGNLLAAATRAAAAAGWHIFGNHLYVPPASPLVQACAGGALQLTPWGPQPAEQRLWLGLGIGAFGYRHPAYYRNTASALEYQAALRHQRLPDKIIYRVPAQLMPGLDAAQSLLCHHELTCDLAPGFCQQLRRDGLLEDAADRCRLTAAGIRQLSAILHGLHRQAASGEDHATQNRARSDR